MTQDFADFRSLVVWQKSQELAVDIVELVRGLPHDRAADALGLQLLRATTSIAVNVAEGYGRYSPAAYRNHLSIARGSLYEAESFLDLLSKTGYLTGEFIRSVEKLCREVARLLTSTMRTLPEPKARYIREESQDYEV